MKLAIALLSLAFANITHASKEGILPLASFHLESAGIGGSGKVVVEGQQDDKDRIAALKVEAFGKLFEVPQEKLRGLSELPTNGIRISYERGYVELGGRTIYIELQMGFTSGVRKQALVTITENGAIEIGAVVLKDT